VKKKHARTYFLRDVLAGAFPAAFFDADAVVAFLALAGFLAADRLLFSAEAAVPFPACLFFLPKTLSQFFQNSGVAPVRMMGPLIVISIVELEMLARDSHRDCVPGMSASFPLHAQECQETLLD